MRHTPFLAGAAIAILFAFAVAGADPATTQQLTATRGERVEIQVSLCAPPAEIRRALDLKPRGPPRDVWLFDDSALAFFDRGLRFRMRVADGRSELTLKIANQDCAQLAPGLLPPNEGKCEYDAHGSSVAGAISLTHTVDAKLARDLIRNRAPLAQALSPAQVRYLRDAVGLWPLPQDARALGPQRVLSYRTADKRYDVDVSTLPTGGEYVEISRKVPVAEVAQSQADAAADLARAKVAVCTDQSAQARNKLRSLLAGPPN